MKPIEQIIAEIHYSLTSSWDGNSFINDLEEGETIAIYGPEDRDGAFAHFESLLTDEQKEALRIQSDLDYDLMMEEQGNREIAGQW